MNQGIVELLIGMIVAPMIVMTIYGFSKALISARLGDPLPKRDRRISLNPLKHIEWIGFILFAVTRVFGWSRPVETSNLYYKNRKRDILITNVTPILILLVSATLFSLLFRQSRAVQAVYLHEVSNLDVILAILFRELASFSVILAVVNLIPISPFDGSKILGLYLNPNQMVGLASKERAILFILTFMMIIWPNNPLTFVLVAVRNFIMSFITMIG